MSEYLRYELFASLVEMLAENYIERKKWQAAAHELMRELAPKTDVMTISRHPLVGSKIVGVAGQQDPNPGSKIWRQSSGDRWVCNTRSAAGKAAQSRISAFPPQPIPTAVYRALGFEYDYIEASDGVYFPLPLSYFPKLHRGFLKWPSTFPPIPEHPDLKLVKESAYWLARESIEAR